MSFRTVVISNRCKLDLKMGYMVVRGEETKRVFIDEISMLLIENTAVSLTGCLLAALNEKKIKVIFCDDKRNPCAELVSYYGSHDCSKKIKMQLCWNEDIKGAVWTDIVREKIRSQSMLLSELGHIEQADMLSGYIDEIEFCDETNREGHAAKVYFNALFGKSFSRGTENAVNAALNYGYSLLLSAFNRDITANGYLTQLGLHHDNMFNHFNLSCDLMEPFRILIDRHVCNRDYKCFEKSEKLELVNILNQYITIDHSEQTVLNAIKIYVRSIFDALNDNDLSHVRFPKI